jgi:hypothetical protein
MGGVLKQQPFQIINLFLQVNKLALNAVMLFAVLFQKLRKNSILNEVASGSMS